MPGSPNLTQPLALRALTALSADCGGWYPKVAIMDRIAADGGAASDTSVDRALRDLAAAGTVVRRWEYPQHQSRRRVYCLGASSRKEPS